MFSTTAITHITDIAKLLKVFILSSLKIIQRNVKVKGMLSIIIKNKIKFNVF